MGEQQKEGKQHDQLHEPGSLNCAVLLQALTCDKPSLQLETYRILCHTNMRGHLSVQEPNARNKLYNVACTSLRPQAYANVAVLMRSSRRRRPFTAVRTRQSNTRPLHMQSLSRPSFWLVGRSTWAALSTQEKVRLLHSLAFSQTRLPVDPSWPLHEVRTASISVVRSLSAVVAER